MGNEPIIGCKFAMFDSAGVENPRVEVTVTLQRKIASASGTTQLKLLLHEKLAPVSKKTADGQRGKKVPLHFSPSFVYNQQRTRHAGHEATRENRDGRNPHWGPNSTSLTTLLKTNKIVATFGMFRLQIFIDALKP